MIGQLVYGLVRANTNYDKPSVPSIKKKKEYQKLSAHEKNKCDKIYNMRERIAKRLDRPPNNIFSNRQIFEIVRKQITIPELVYGKGLSASVKKEINNGLSKLLK